MTKSPRNCEPLKGLGSKLFKYIGFLLSDGFIAYLSFTYFPLLFGYVPIQAPPCIHLMTLGKT